MLPASSARRPVVLAALLALVAAAAGCAAPGATTPPAYPESFLLAEDELPEGLAFAGADDYRVRAATQTNPGPASREMREAIAEDQPFSAPDDVWWLFLVASDDPAVMVDVAALRWNDTAEAEAALAVILADEEHPCGDVAVTGHIYRAGGVILGVAGDAPHQDAVLAALLAKTPSLANACPE